MLVPIKWLKDYVDIQLTPSQLADKLVSCGFEIEQIIDLSSKVTNVVTARVATLTKHPSADKLNVATLDIGLPQTIQVVTNAHNIKEGDIVPVALDGAVLANGMQIKKGELRGVPSAGMLCGGEEIAADDSDYMGASYNGVLVMAANTPIGTDINIILGRDEIVLDIGITANRTDANSIYGIAREVAAVTGEQLKPLNFQYSQISSDIAANNNNIAANSSDVAIDNSDISTDNSDVATDNSDIAAYLSLENIAEDLCPRYVGKVVKDITICQSPNIIKQRLRAVGLRPINNIVDITNYVLYEVGQPMHAFDIDTIAGGKIVVRRAGNGEQITCLDDKQYTLNDSNLVIANAKEAMAVAGIMGGKNYSISPNTHTIVLESARFARDNVRKTSRSLNLRSDSSARFEKGIDFWSQDAGLNRALSLISQYGWGKIVGGVVDSLAQKPADREILFSVSDIIRILGTDITADTAISILNSLTIPISPKGDKIAAVIPPYRDDIVGVNDIAEEIIRIYGYDRITPTLIKHGDMVVGGRTKQQEIADKLKNVLLANGVCEIVTYSFVSPKSLDSLCLPQDSPLRNTIKLDNPLGEDFSIMRTTLAHSMIKTISTNYLRGNKAVRLFEVSKTYIPKSLPLTEYPIEKNMLCMGSLGDDYYTFKAILEDLFSVLRIEVSFVRETKPYLHEGRSAAIITKDGYNLGYIGEVLDIVAANYDVDKRIYIAELDCEYLVENARVMLPFKVMPKYPSVERDIAIVCPNEAQAADLLKIIRDNAGDLLTDCYVFDVYCGEKIEVGKKSVAIKLICQSYQKTLKDEDVNALIDTVLAALDQHAGAKLR